MKVVNILENSFMTRDERPAKYSQKDLDSWVQIYKNNCSTWPTSLPLHRFTSKIGLHQSTARKNIFYSRGLWTFLKSHKEYEDFPDRLKSIFCTTGESSDVVGSFRGDTHEYRMIIPADSVSKFAYTDFDFNFMPFHYDGSELSDVHENYSNEELEELYKEGHLTPEKLGIELLTRIEAIRKVREAKNENDHDNEFWFEGEYLAIPKSAYKYFLETLHNTP